MPLLRRVCVGVWLASIGWAGLHGPPASAQTPGVVEGPLVTAGDWGGVGLLQTRTARFETDGQFNVGYSFANPYKRYSFSLTFFPWLEGTFRYTEVRSRLYSEVPGFSGDQRYKDRGADLKFRIWDEGRYRPAVAVGFQDLLGTGLFAGEYFVASKRLGDFDVSAGIGWGTIGSGGGLKNPFIALSSEFAGREGTGGPGGQLAVFSFFGGQTVGVFGGVEYHTPIHGLSLKLEYDANTYNTPDVVYAPTSAVNFAAVFRPYRWFELSLGQERGNTAMLRFTVRTSLNDVGGVPKADPPPPPLTPRLPLAAFTPSSTPLPADAAPERGAPVVAPPPATAAPTVGSQLLPAPQALATPETFFEALDRLGVTAERIEVAEREGYIDLSVGDATVPLAELASLALHVMPEDVVALTVSAATARGERASVRVERAGPAPDRTADLYEAFSVLGLDVRDVALDGDSVRILVGAPDPATADLASAARVAALAVGAQGTVTVVGSWGSQASWPPRTNAPVTAGQEGPVSAAPLTFTADQRRVASERLNDSLRHEGLVLEFVELEPTRVVVGLYSFRFREYSRNLGVAARAVANALPASVEEVTIAFLNGGVEISRVTFLRRELELAAVEGGAPEDFWAHAVMEPGQPWWDGTPVPWRYPRFAWSAGPQLRQHIGGPDRFYLYQLWLSLSASIDIARGLSLSGQVGKNVYHGFDRIRLTSDSQLPRVRSDIKEYLQKGADNIVRLQTTYLFKPAEDLYARVSAGLLEEMYGGVSGELLFRPYTSRFALGLEISRVQQRDFDQRFDFRNYKVTTGHVSMYYDTPFSGVLATAHMGRYLAGDRGVTFELSRQFDSGVRVGAWATMTNVSPQAFGEGSFDKGFYIVIPFDLFLTRSTASQGVFAFRPLTRDGGQRLNLSNRLYDLTGTGNLGVAARDWPNVLR